MKVRSDEMTEFTQAGIDRLRGIMNDGGEYWSRSLALDALDEIERLQDLMLAYENDLVLLSVYGKLKRAEERIAELEQERWWIPVREYPSQQGWYRVIINDGTEKVRFYKRDTENDREYWHVANNKEWIMMWTNPCLPQEPKEEE